MSPNITLCFNGTVCYLGYEQETHNEAAAISECKARDGVLATDIHSIDHLNFLKQHFRTPTRRLGFFVNPIMYSATDPMGVDILTNVHASKQYVQGFFFYKQKTNV